MVYEKFLRVVLEVIVFLVLLIIFTHVRERLGRSNHRLLNPKEYFPNEELHSLRQILYLIMMGLCFIDILYFLTFPYNDVFYLSIFDIALSLYLAIQMDKSTLKGKIIVFLLIPFGSLTFIIYGYTLAGILDFIHVPVFLYFIKHYYERFREYTVSNGLGMTIILLFTLVFLSFFATQLSEGVNPLDSLVMVSNAFTSNGYAVLGRTIPGKINSIVLVWGGFLLSGVGTATLTSGILINHYRKKLKKIYDKLEKLEDMISELKEE